MCRVCPCREKLSRVYSFRIFHLKACVEYAHVEKSCCVESECVECRRCPKQYEICPNWNGFLQFCRVSYGFIRFPTFVFVHTGTINNLFFVIFWPKVPHSLPAQEWECGIFGLGMTKNSIWTTGQKLARLVFERFRRAVGFFFPRCVIYVMDTVWSFYLCNIVLWKFK